MVKFKDTAKYNGMTGYRIVQEDFYGHGAKSGIRQILDERYYG
jgi:hypothetical protein